MAEDDPLPVGIVTRSDGASKNGTPEPMKESGMVFVFVGVTHVFSCYIEPEAASSPLVDLLIGFWPDGRIATAVVAAVAREPMLQGVA